ncbi:hypothetical protein AeRB84_017970 [Aphanomyces euteiches]|nr:hypothetical protein AeRB84_017970 [Aphanomyces euteiches]
MRWRLLWFLLLHARTSKSATSLPSSLHLQTFQRARDSGFNWVALFNTTDGLPIDEQVSASTTSKDCAALNVDVGKLNVSSCSVWNVDLAALVKQGLQKWYSAKHTYIFMEVAKECTTGQVAAFVASVKASPNLESCSKAVGLTFFTRTFSQRTPKSQNRWHLRNARRSSPTSMNSKSIPACLLGRLQVLLSPMDQQLDKVHCDHNIVQHDSSAVGGVHDNSSADHNDGQVVSVDNRSSINQTTAALHGHCSTSVFMAFFIARTPSIDTNGTLCGGRARQQDLHKLQRSRE